MKRDPRKEERNRIRKILKADGKVHRPPESSLRLGRRISPPAKSPFSCPMRSPDWHADADPSWLPLPGGGVNQFPSPLFPEETVGRVVLRGSTVEYPFSISKFDRASAPGKKGWLGGRLPLKPKDPFDFALLEFARRARNYNSSLYLLRLYHFAYDRKKDLSYLPENKKGPKLDDGSLIPRPKYGDPTFDFDFYAQIVEERWLTATQQLNAPFEAMNPSAADFAFYADMIQVNGYIVSMRVVLTPTSPPGREISGSSSHVSIDYPFSSEYSSIDILSK